MTQYYKETAPAPLTEYGIEFFLQKRINEGVTARAHIHPAIELIYIARGRFEIGIDGDTVFAEVGDLVLFRANAIHTIKHIAEGEGAYYVLKINPTLLFQIFAGGDCLSCVIPFIRKNRGDVSHFSASVIPTETRKILDQMIAEYNQADKLFFAAERAFTGALLVSLLRTLIPVSASVDGEADISEKNVALIYESVKYINENYASDITPAECAAVIHLSYSYFAKIFRAVMGKTFKEYLTGVRLAKAHTVLISTDIPITDVAIACGYGNLSYFISEYGRVYGKTPRDTRKELLGK